MAAVLRLDYGLQTRWSRLELLDLMMDEQQTEEKLSQPKCRWSSYNNYRLILWVWMMNDATVMFSPAEVSVMGFYVHGAIQAASVILIGIPLVYSEICIAQYTNCNIITIWDYFPLFRFVGYGTLYLIFLKTIYYLVLTAWYLEYSFFATMDPPPWFTCAEFNDSKCMVKSVNVSLFQHCLEAELEFNDDCGMKTASNCFFEREIGDNNTSNSIYCLLPWKTLIASTAVNFLLFTVSIRKDKFIQVYVKLLLAYLCIATLILFCVALSKSGTWYASNTSVDWKKLEYIDIAHSMIRGILCVGSGCGMIIFLSRDVPFRSPATMTSISVSLISVFISIMLTLITFGGIKTMVYFHGEEQNVVEIGNSIFFVVFASITEIMNYFDAFQLWSFVWFSTIFFCLFADLWIFFLFLGDLILEIDLVRKYKNFSRVIVLFIISVFSWPFFCSDLTVVLLDATEIMQITNSFLFSLSLYWFYGFNKHNIDIIFMIGVKASYFWKICWFLSPIFHVVILYTKWSDLSIFIYDFTYHIHSLDIRLDELLLYIILAIYFAILIFGLLFQIYIYYCHGAIRDIFSPSVDWGPRDKVLYKSRKMFVPEIMTTEFLYRQVRVQGYGQNKSVSKTQVKRTHTETDGPNEDLHWSALTSN